MCNHGYGGVGYLVRGRGVAGGGRVGMGERRVGGIDCVEGECVEGGMRGCGGWVDVEEGNEET